MTTTEDRFLGGRVIVRQTPHGFRAGLDAVMLAAAVPAVAGETLLELGSGAGTASLCLARRVDGACVTGVEIDAALVRLAAENTMANGMGDRVSFAAGDALNPPESLRRQFDHVFCNPPFHNDDGAVSPDSSRAVALHDAGTLGAWITAGMKRTVSGGTFTLILRGDRLGEALAALPERGVHIFPLWPRAGAAAKRILMQVHQGSRAPVNMLPGLVLHEADGRYTSDADAVLRGSGLTIAG
ncbi:MAG: methyltransferase [Alphaproteobacteria bacterium]|nr:methyltransferase [Alphaproteobacteria bacterium]